MAEQQPIASSPAPTRRGRSALLLFLMLLIAVVSWTTEHGSHGHVAWARLLEPVHLGSLLGVIGSVCGARLTSA